MANARPQLGRYHIGESLGSGPTGRVYRAKAIGLAGFEREFAVKQFHTGVIAISGVVDRLAAEARSYGALDHPRIARLHEYSVVNGVPFAATELCLGLDLKKLQAQLLANNFSRIPAGASMAFLATAARAIGHAHSKRLSHRGLSPTNIMCSPDGEPKITDFGFLDAWLSNHPSPLSQLGERARYTTPEHVRGEPRSEATDVFQLGLIGVELLKGQPAFVQPHETLPELVSSAQVDLSAVPESLTDIFQKALARDPKQRFSNAREMADAIDASLRRTPLPGNKSDIARYVEKMMGSSAAPTSTTVPAEGAQNQSGKREQEPLGRTLRGAPVPASAAKKAPAEQRVQQRMQTGSPIDLRDTVSGHPARTASDDDAFPDGPTDIRPPDFAALARAASAVPLETKVPDVPSTRPATNNPNTGHFYVPQEDSPQASPDAHTMMPPSQTAPHGMPAQGQHQGPPNAGYQDPISNQQGVPSAVSPGSQPLTEPVLNPNAAERTPSMTGDPIYASALPPTGGKTKLLWIVALALAGVWVTWLALFLGDELGKGEPAAKAQAASATSPAGQVSSAASSVASSVSSAAPPPTELTLKVDVAKAVVYLNHTKVEDESGLVIPWKGNPVPVAVFAPGYSLFVGKAEEPGLLKISMQKAPKFDDKGGVKVRCKKESVYYVFVDGKDTGQLCPTDRIKVGLGNHTVETYDLTTGERKTFDATVKQTRYSKRVYVD